MWKIRKFYFLNHRAVEIQKESLCSPKIKTKMPTRTKNVEMKNIVTNLEIHLHYRPCEPSGFKIGRSSHRRCSMKKVFLKILQIWQEDTCDKVSFLSFLHENINSVTGFFLSVLQNFWEKRFYRTLLGDWFWVGLVVRRFNSVSLNFLNLHLYHAPREWLLLFWCNKEHLLLNKTKLNSK